jgi:hypothetical protein
MVMKFLCSWLMDGIFRGVFDTGVRGRPSQDWIKAFNTVLPQARDRTDLVSPHQTGVTDRIGRDNRRQTPLLSDHDFPLCRSTKS